jgi:hypothetical protein
MNDYFFDRWREGVMSDSNDRVSIELIDAGEHKDRVVLVLSKVKGLTMAPQQIVSSTPCTVATDVPRSAAEKLQGFLEKAGAMVMLEGEEEEELISPEETPLPGEEEQAELEEPAPAEEVLESSEEVLESSEEDLFSESEEETMIPDFPSPGLPESETEETEPIEEKESGIFQKLLSRLLQLGRKKEQAEAETEIEKPGKKSPLAFLSKFRKKATEEPSEEISPELHEPAEGARKKIPDLMSHPASLVVVGFLLGVVFMGTWGLLSSRSLEKQWEQRMHEYDKQTAKQIEEHSADLKNNLKNMGNMVKQLLDENTVLKEQIATLTTQLEETRKPTSIIPSQIPEAEMVPQQKELIQSFQELMAIHAQSLENGYDAQKQAKCSQQLLLDGKSTYTYAQVVKKFSSKHMRYEIMKSNSLTAPYIANFKIPFQQEIRTGKTEEACNQAKLQQLETPDHHEFGGYYGYWEIEYEYKDGKWVVNPTVIEKNRALYESAFQHGSPDYAKFRINTNLFPAFKTP